MARISIEDDFWGDPRLRTLQKKIGEDTAIGQVLRLWKLGLQYWKNRRPIPFEAYQFSELSDALFECGFAEKMEDGIYVKGSKTHFEWLAMRVESGRKGGKAVSSKINNLVQAKPKHSEATPKPLTLTLTLKDKKENTCAFENAQKKSKNSSKGKYTEEFELIWSRYPCKKDKKSACKKYQAAIQKAGLQESFKLALENYLQEIAAKKTEPQFVKHLKTFLGSWEEYLVPEPLDGGLSGLSPERKQLHDAKAAKSMAAWDEDLKKLVEAHDATP